MKPRIRPVMRAGESLIWECLGFSNRALERRILRGTGYTPEEAYWDWKAQL